MSEIRAAKELINAIYGVGSAAENARKQIIDALEPFLSYCAADVEVTREAYLYMLPNNERKRRGLPLKRKNALIVYERRIKHGRL